MKRWEEDYDVKRGTKKLLFWEDLKQFNKLITNRNKPQIAKTHEPQAQIELRFYGGHKVFN